MANAPGGFTPATDSAWAHAHPQGPEHPAHGLPDHLMAVASLAASFAPPGSAALAELAGRWHDLGKFRPGFQRNIRSAGAAEDHIDPEQAARFGSAPWIHPAPGKPRQNAVQASSVDALKPAALR